MSAGWRTQLALPADLAVHTDQRALADDGAQAQLDSLGLFAVRAAGCGRQGGGSAAGLALREQVTAQPQRLIGAHSSWVSFCFGFFLFISVVLVLFLIFLSFSFFFGPGLLGLLGLFLLGRSFCILVSGVLVLLHPLLLRPPPVVSVVSERVSSSASPSVSTNSKRLSVLRSVTSVTSCSVLVLIILARRLARTATSSTS